MLKKEEGAKVGMNLTPSPLKIKTFMGMKPIHSSPIFLRSRKKKLQAMDILGGISN